MSNLMRSSVAWWRRVVGRGVLGRGASRSPSGAPGTGRTQKGGPTGGETGAPTEHDRRWMARAIELARDASARGEVPVGAVVYRTESGELLGEGANARETDHDPTAHAELLAVRRAAARTGDWRLDGCTVVVTLEPCPMCAGMLVNARVGRVVYGADDPKAGACRSLFAITTDARLNHRCEVVEGVEAEMCARLLTEFFRARRAENKARRAGDARRHQGGNDA